MVKEADPNALISVVSQQVFADLSKALDEIYPKILEAIQKSVRQEFLERIDALEKHAQNLEARLKKQEAQVHSAAAVPAKNTQAPQPDALRKLCGSATSAPSVNMKRYEIRSGFRYNGWIYYVNPDQADFLFCVREDGTGNKQLTDFSVCSGFHVDRGYLCFTDKNWDKHRIRVD